MKIAVYTIALNEEKHVERWYESAKDADYLLIADTGSTDKTVEIAESLGINVFKISVKPWRFDDARNAALALLPDDIDYCVSMDMDETLSEGWREKLEQMTASQITYIFHLSYKDEAEKVPHHSFINERIHKRHGFRWRWLMHEALVVDRLENYTRDFCEGLTVSHHPDYDKPRSQYNQLIADALAEEPDSPRYTFYLANEYEMAGDHKNAITYYKKYLKLPQSNDINDRCGVLCKLSFLEPKNAKKYLLQASEEAIMRREPLVLLSRLAFLKEDWDECYDYITKALKITKKHYGISTQEYAWQYLPYNILAVAKHNKDLDKNSPTYKDDTWKMNIDSVLASEFDLFGEAPKEEKPEPTLFDVI